jgi:hypothetical protein
VYPYHINDPEFADALVDTFLEISLGKPKCSTHLQNPVSEPNLELQDVSNLNSSSCETICYSPSNYPDARPGYSQKHFSIIIICQNVGFYQSLMKMRNYTLSKQCIIELFGKF